VQPQQTLKFDLSNKQEKHSSIITLTSLKVASIMTSTYSFDSFSLYKILKVKNNLHSKFRRRAISNLEYSTSIGTKANVN